MNDIDDERETVIETPEKEKVFAGKIKRGTSIPTILTVRTRPDEKNMYATIPKEVRELLDLKAGDKLHIRVLTSDTPELKE